MRFLAFLSFVFALVCLLVPAAMLKLPPEYLPWTPLDLQSAPNYLTEYKLSKISSNPLLCKNTFETSKAEFEFLPNRKSGNCELENLVALRKSLYPYSSPVNASCALSAALVLWEREILKPLAMQHFSSDVKNIEQLGIFACRNVRNSTSRVSQHASANAIDISGFVLKNGKTVNIARDWARDSAEGRFLKELRDQSCSMFRAVLGPDYNALHRDHFHFDFGRYRICR